MKTKLLRKTRAYIRKYHPDVKYLSKGSEHYIMSKVAVELLEEIFYDWEWGFGDAYKIIIKHKLFNKQ